MICKAWRWFKGTSMPFWGKRILQRPGEPSYMVRYHLFVTRWLVVYLNAILTPDRDERLHTHPWKRAHSFKVKGSYWERIPAAHAKRCTGEISMACVDGEWCLIHRPKRWSRVPERHRIVELLDGPVWTLFFGVGAKRPWGFQNDDGSVTKGPGSL